MSRRTTRGPPNLRQTRPVPPVFPPARRGSGVHGLPGLPSAKGPVIASKKKKKKSIEEARAKGEKPITENRKARHQYDVLETLECGIALVGTEVKSLREGKVSLAEAYGRVRGDEVWLVGCDIPEYSHGSQFNHEPRRPRKLLLHRREIKKFANKALEKGLTLVPLKMYFKQGKAKVLMGLCRGRQLHDKREKMKTTTMKKEMERAARSRR